MPLGVIRSIVSRKYTDFRGIDLLNNETEVDPRRSPDCLNVWKSYNLAQSNIIQTRPGITLIANLGEGSIHSMYVYSSDTAIVHIGEKLIKWVGFPNDVITITELKNDMEDNESVMFYFKEDIYILDGENYLKYNGVTLVNVSDIAFVPTTTIGRSPSGRRRNVSRCKLVNSKT